MKTLFGIFTSILLMALPVFAVPESPAEIQPILPGSKVSSIEVNSKDGEAVDLTRKLSKGRTVLIFYRGGWCPYCNEHLMDVQNREAELKTLGFNIIAISPDSPKTLLSSKDLGLEYQSYSDSSLSAAKAFGVAYKVDDKMHKKLKGYNIDIEKASGKTHRVLPVPGIFIVDKGVVESSYVNPDYRKRLSGDVLYAAAKFSKEN